MSDSASLRALPGLLEGMLEAAATASLGVVVTRLQDPFSFVFASPRAAAMLGLTVAELLASDPLTLAGPSREVLAEVLAAQQRGTWVPRPLNVVVCPANGRQLPLEVAVSVLAIDGVRHSVALLRDVTEEARAAEGLRRSEARLRALIESAPDAIVLSRARALDVSARSEAVAEASSSGGSKGATPPLAAPEAPQIVFANSAAAQLLGVSDASALIGRSFSEFLHPDDVRTMGERIARLTLGGAPLGPHEYRARAADGRAVVVEVTSVLFDDQDGPAVLGFARDVTEGRRLQAQLVRADRLAALGTMAAGVAHEINNPLAFMMLGLDAIERRVETMGGARAADPTSADEVRSTLADVRHGVDRIATIVRQLRAFSRPGERVGRGPAYLPVVIQSVTQMAAHEVRQYGQLSVDVADDLPPVRGDGSQLEQVLLNLVLNAAQALDVARGEGHIRIEARRAEDAFVEIAVIDDGRGIAESELARVFDPFFTTKPAGAGTGLGLSICHSIVASLGGEITVESTVGRGTVVRVRLPAYTRALRPSTPPRAVRRDPLAAPLRVLVVDDDAAFLRAVERSLGDEADVWTTTDAERAWDAIEGGERGARSASSSTTDRSSAPPDPRQFDVILVDVMMPGRSGLELFDRLRAAQPGLVKRVGFVTGGAARPEIERLLAEAKRPILRKPFDVDQLHALVRRLVGA